MRQFYLLACCVGTALPWLSFAQFFAQAGIDIAGFARGLYANGAAGGFATDVMLSILVFWVWSYCDARRSGVSGWWWVLPAGCFVGLSLALPLYLYKREGASAL